MNALLSSPPKASEVVAFRPEFVDAKGLRALFGISRSHGYFFATRRSSPHRLLAASWDKSR